MQLTLHNPDSGYFIRRVGPQAIMVVDRELQRSFVLTQSTLVEQWPVADVSRLEPPQVEAILALGVDVVLLGTGTAIKFPTPSIMAAFLTRGVGVEVMDNAAAARTFNVLAQEGRNVAAAFILPEVP